MALIKYGAIIEKITGKVGGSVFATTNQGSYMKNLGYKSKQMSSIQTTSMNFLIQSAQTWRTLSEEERQAYEDNIVNYPYINRAGEESYYTAFQLFQKLYTSLLQINITTLPEINPSAVPSLISSAILVQDNDSFILSLPSISTASLYSCFVSKQVSPGRFNPPSNFFRLFQFIGRTNPTNFQLQTALIYKFGTINPELPLYFYIQATRFTSGNTRIVWPVSKSVISE